MIIIADSSCLISLNNIQVSHHIVSQIYEGLTRFNPKYLTIEPCLAKSWKTNNAGTLYTFNIRSGEERSMKYKEVRCIWQSLF